MTEDFDKDISLIKNLETKCITDHNVMEVTVGTTGGAGGDRKHGGRTYLSLEDCGGTAWAIRVNGLARYPDLNKLEILFGGDAELDVFIEALEFAVKKLNQRRSQ